MYNKYIKYKIKYLKLISLNKIGGSIEGKGIRSYGNTCYINAGLQLYFRMSKLMDIINIENVFKTKTKITEALLNIYEEWKNPDPSISINYTHIDTLRKELCNINSMIFPIGAQADTSEMLIYLNSHIQENLQDSDIKNKFINLYKLTQRREIESWDPNKWYLGYQPGLKTDPETSKQSCDYKLKSESYDIDFLCLEINLEIMQFKGNLTEYIIDLSEQIKSKFNSLDINEGMFCSTQEELLDKSDIESSQKDEIKKSIKNCKNNLTIRTIADIYPTYILLLNKILLGYDVDTQQKIKNKFKKIIINPTILIKENITYKLIGFVCHYGTAEGGHYIFILYSHTDNTWIFYDNDNVYTESNLDKIERAKLNMSICLYEKDIKKKSKLTTHHNKLCF